MHNNITFVNKANFVKLYNNYVLKWLNFALYVVVVPEQILLGSVWRTLEGFVTSVQWVYRWEKLRPEGNRVKTIDILHKLDSASLLVKLKPRIFQRLPPFE
jgi:hypothetical protein